MGIVLSLINIVKGIFPPAGLPLGLGVDGAVGLALVILIVVIPNNFINWDQVGKWIWDNLVPEFIKIPINTVKNFNPFNKKDSFVSPPVKYKKQLNNDGGIGWVPYYGKPGRLCEEDKDCPTFQKCNENKCVIPLGVS
tara:strand:+ start:397 stop:810 length:414 start_codon:yes stop_codon:yes gene_type:complete